MTDRATTAALIAKAMHAKTTDNYIDWFDPQAEELRLLRCVERLAREGFKPGESVPPRVMRMVEDRRAGRMEIAA